VRGTARSRELLGALHLGPRPTFQGAPPSIEVHFMDFDGDLYGEDLRIDFIRHLRGVEPFDSVQALVEQMQRDVDLARRVLEEED
jgi:riboflavin kinase / FMN adenylyltransferase